MPDNDGQGLTWWGWARPETRPELRPGARRWLAATTGWQPRATPRVSDVQLPDSVLPEPTRRTLTAIVGPEHVHTDHATRLQHAGGKSYVDLMRRRAGVADAPDAVLTPADHEQVAAILTGCTQHGVAVVPFGGGTSVVGGVEPLRDGFSA